MTNQGFGGGRYHHDDDKTQQIWPVDGEETRVMGGGQRPQHPRQYFPGEGSAPYPGTSFGQGPAAGGYGYDAGYVPSSYDAPTGEPPRRQGSTAALVAIIAALVVIALALAFFFWRMSEWDGRDRQPTPPPVTETVTTQMPTTVTETAPAPETETPQDDSGPTQWPTELPSELPTELGDDLDRQLEDLLNSFGGDGQGA